MMNIVQKLLRIAKASAFKQTVALLSHGNVSLQKGYVDTEEDFDRMAAEVLKTDFQRL